MARGDAATSWWCNKTTGGRHNERMTRGDATTSWHEEMTQGRRNKRRHNFVVLRVQTQTESTDEVAAMVIARDEHKPERLGFGNEL